MKRILFMFGALALATSLAAGQTASHTPQKTSPVQLTPRGDIEDNAAGSIPPGQHPTTASATPDPTALTTTQQAYPPQAQQLKAQSPAVPQGEAPLPSSNVSDSASLQQQLNQAYESEPSLNGSKINVAVTDSQVELTGTVPTNKDKIAAARIAKSYAGNRKVVDKVSVAGVPSSSGQKY